MVSAGHSIRKQQSLLIIKGRHKSAATLLVSHFQVTQRLQAQVNRALRRTSEYLHGECWLVTSNQKQQKLCLFLIKGMLYISKTHAFW
jgi:hypothetical protein